MKRHEFGKASVTWGELVGSYLEKARAQRNDPEVAAHLGEVLWSLGRKEEARKVWTSALVLHPADEKLLSAIKRLTP